MPKAILTEEQQTFIIENRLSMSSRDLAEKCDYTDGVVQRFLRNKGLSLTQEQWQKIRSEKQKKVTTSDSTTDYLLKELYLLMPVKTMGDFIGRSDTFIKTRMRQLELVQPRELINEFVAEFRRKKGDAPPNKGKKQIEYMSPEAIERTRATRFKKGQCPPNMLHYKDGDITIRWDKLKDGAMRPYKWLRLKRREWKMLHVFNWEQVNGPVPDGHIIVFKNGDSMICDNDNLECITLEENMRRNSIHRFPVELKQTIRIISKIKKTIKKKQNA